MPAWVMSFFAQVVAWFASGQSAATLPPPTPPPASVIWASPVPITLPTAVPTAVVIALPSATPFAPPAQDVEGPGHHEPDGDGPSASPVAQQSSQPAPTSPPAVAVAPTPISSSAPQVPVSVYSPSPVQTVNPVPQPSVSPVAAPGPYPIYSQLFTGNTPFHHTVAELMAAGATVRSDSVAANYWAQGLGSVNVNMSAAVIGGPYIVSAPGSPTYTFQCPAYGGCNAGGKLVSYPPGATPTTDSDHHLQVLDLIHAQEVDGWGGDGGGCAIGGGTVNCSSGGVFPFSGDGLAHGGSANAAGIAFGLYLTTAREITQGHIDHALGIEQSCLDNGGVYPATVGRSTDSACNGSNGAEPNARYGDLIHLKSSVTISSLSTGRTCQVVLAALQRYGAYTIDNNGSWGRTLLFDVPGETAGPVWAGFIFPEMVADGDASGSGSQYSTHTCLQRIPAADIEVLTLNQGGDSALPPQ